MKKIVIEGGRKLRGIVRVNGAKNSAVALFPAAILAGSTVTIDGLPNISDVETLRAILEDLDVKVEKESAQKVKIDPSNMTYKSLPNGKVKKLRASYYLMGAMLGKFKRATLGLPGGCFLGPRPIDQHIKGFEALGATVRHEDGMIHIEAKELTGARIYLDVVSVGATINIMLAAVLAKGKTTIENAAKEPEIIDVATLLTNMGAKIKGVGTDIIRIEGVDSLHGCSHMIIPDRIEAGTYAIMAAAQGEDVTIDNVIPEHLESLIAKLREIGVEVDQNDEQLFIRRKNGLKSVDIKTLVYPGFPTDLQQPFSVLLTQASGTSIVTDTIYTARFKHIHELTKMNVDAKVEGNAAIIDGPTPLKGAKVRATDLRAGAALVTAGLIADGTTEIYDIYHLKRGYEKMTEKLATLGADIKEEPITEEETNALTEWQTGQTVEDVKRRV